MNVPYDIILLIFNLSILIFIFIKFFLMKKSRYKKETEKLNKKKEAMLKEIENTCINIEKDKAILEENLLKIISEGKEKKEKIIENAKKETDVIFEKAKKDIESFIIKEKSSIKDKIINDAFDDIVEMNKQVRR